MSNSARQGRVHESACSGTRQGSASIFAVALLVALFLFGGVWWFSTEAEDAPHDAPHRGEARNRSSENSAADGTEEPARVGSSSESEGTGNAEMASDSSTSSRRMNDRVGGGLKPANGTSSTFGSHRISRQQDVPPTEERRVVRGSGTSGGGRSTRDGGSAARGDSTRGETSDSTPGDSGNSVLLRIVGLGGGGDLQGVTLLRFSNTRNRIHPGDWSSTHEVVVQGESPLTLPPRSGTAHYWAHVPGYSWGHIVIDHDDGGERRLALEQPSSQLQLRLENFPAVESLLLSLSRDHVRGPGVELAAAAEMTLVGLQPGRYFLQVGWGGENSAPLSSAAVLVGEQELQLVAGSQELSVQLSDFPDLSGHVPLDGAVVFEGNWDDPGLALRLQPLDTPTIRGLRTLTIDGSELELIAGQLHWSAGLVQPGRYRLSLEPWGWCHNLTVDIGGEISGAICVVPPPVDVVVEVVDRQTGQRVPLQGAASFRTLNAWYSGSESLRSCRPIYSLADEQGFFSFVVPRGQSTFSQLYDDIWRVDSVNFNFDDNSGSVVVEADRALGLRLRFFDGEVPIPAASLPTGIIVQGTGDNPPRVVSRQHLPDSDGLLFRLSNAGSCSITIPTLTGFETIPLQTIEVPAAEFVPVDISLVPAN